MQHRNTHSPRGSLLALALAAGVTLALGACSSGDESNGPVGTGGSGQAANRGGSSSASSGNGGSGASVGSGAATGADGGSAGSTDGGAQGAASGAGGAAAGSGATNGGSLSGGAATGSTACSNGIDDDGDGLIDGFDPECTGPLDGDEGSFATGIPGDNRDPKWQDCFFDGNSGAGDDHCRYATGCLTGELPQDDPHCTVSDACIKFCARLTQNGCDCFGCCTIQKTDGSTVDIVESSGCSLANIDDAKACQRCTKNTQCGNECGECELCPGKTAEQLPDSCRPPTGSGGSPSTGGASNGGAGGASAGEPGSGGEPPVYNCDGGLQVCGPGLPDCSATEYCSLGCCLPAVR